MDWDDWRRHIDQVIADKGQWVGLCDGWGRPIREMPPILSMTAPEARLSPSSLDLTVETTGGAHVPVHPVVDDMVADGLGVFDEEGRLVVKDHIVDMVVIARWGRRRAFVTSFPTASGGAIAPGALKIQGADLLDRLAMWPCPSVPSSWTPDKWQVFTGDVVEYNRPRELAMVDLAVVADGYTMHGPAEATIKTLIQDSFDAANRLKGWEGTEHMVVDMAPTGRDSEDVTIRVQDEMLWDTVVESAQLAGVNIRADLWWPGDDPVLTRDRDRQGTSWTTWDRPIGVVRVEQI